ncbi:MAG: alpha/beta fold hydrolase [Flavobacteriales bacterium]|nr:alpha/beta fold hydrolase [Flavobacteriales bacterium]
MPILTADYRPARFFRNGHVNTIFSSLFRKIPQVSFTRKRIDTTDDDFLDIDFIKSDNRKVVVLCHGLEGNSSSKYIQGASGILNANGYDIAAMNYRHCSGEINRQLRTYHSGMTEDLHTVINDLLPDYDEVFLVGFSLGGNIVLKYIGDGIYPLHPKLKATVAISVLVDLYGAVMELSKLKNRVYTKRFLKSLCKKMRAKQEQYPSHIDLALFKKVKDLIDFDDCFTAPLNGFENARDYYAKCSSKQFLQNIKIPTLIINALDDPFMSKTCYPTAEAANNNYLNLMTPKYGGHVGFFNLQKEISWSEEQILTFFHKY